MIISTKKDRSSATPPKRSGGMNRRRNLTPAGCGTAFCTAGSELVSYNVATGANYPNTDVSRAPYPTFGNVSMWRFGGLSNYHGLQTALTKRFSQRWQASATYSLSWLYDSDAVPAIPCYYGPGDFRPCPENFTVARDIGGGYSLAVGDQRHRAVVNGIWQLPMGFRVSGLYFFGSGERRSVVFGANLRQFGTGTTGRLRPDGSIVPRNYFVGDAVHRVDLRATKQVPIAGSVRLEVVSEDSRPAWLSIDDVQYPCCSRQLTRVMPAGAELRALVLTAWRPTDERQSVTLVTTWQP